MRPMLDEAAQRELDVALSILLPHHGHEHRLRQQQPQLQLQPQSQFTPSSTAAALSDSVLPAELSAFALPQPHVPPPRAPPPPPAFPPTHIQPAVAAGRGRGAAVLLRALLRRPNVDSHRRCFTTLAVTEHGVAQQQLESLTGGELCGCGRIR